MNFFSKFLPLVLLCTVLESSFAKIAEQSVANSIDESYVYKITKNPRSLSDKDESVLAFLKRRDKVSPTSKEKQPIKIHEVFTLETVNGEPITNVDVINAIKLIFFFSGKNYDRDIAKMMFSAVLEELETSKLRGQCARMFGIKVSDIEVIQEIQRLAASNGITEQELLHRFNEAGIGFKMVKDFIKSKIIAQLITNSLIDSDKISNTEVETEKRVQRAIINSKRYYALTMFMRQEDSAKKIPQLVKEGFDLKVLAENFSQTTRPEKRGTIECLQESAIEPEVLKVLKNMNPGEMSDVIKTKSGYKIVYLFDIANPGKAPQSSSTFKFLRASATLGGKLFTQKDIQKNEEVIGKLLKAKNVEDFKKICSENEVEYKEETIQRPDPYYMELLTRSKRSGTPAVLQSQEDQYKVNIVLFLDQKENEAKIPNDEQIKEIILENKIAAEKERTFKKVNAGSHIEKNQANINRMINECA